MASTVRIVQLGSVRRYLNDQTTWPEPPLIRGVGIWEKTKSLLPLNNRMNDAV